MNCVMSMKHKKLALHAELKFAADKMDIVRTLLETIRPVNAELVGEVNEIKEKMSKLNQKIGEKYGFLAATLKL
jgi:uncharacterized coiled-coil DUF342 family protein